MNAAVKRHNERYSSSAIVLLVYLKAILGLDRGRSSLNSIWLSSNDEEFECLNSATDRHVLTEEYGAGNYSLYSEDTVFARLNGLILIM